MSASNLNAYCGVLAAIAAGRTVSQEEISAVMAGRSQEEFDRDLQEARDRHDAWQNAGHNAWKNAEGAQAASQECAVAADQIASHVNRYLANRHRYIVATEAA